jgi:hypothetical protein
MRANLSEIQADETAVDRAVRRTAISNVTARAFICTTPGRSVDEERRVMAVLRRGMAGLEDAEGEIRQQITHRRKGNKCDSERV